MATYRVVDTEEREVGTRIECVEHGESETFEPGYRKVAFHCDVCGIEIGVHLEDTEDWRELTEMC